MSEPAQTIKERPILFSGPMVQALLADIKTQTRRVVKPQPSTPVRYDGQCHDGGEVHYWEQVDTEGLGTEHYTGFECPYGRVGDRLWVRETFFCNSFDYPEVTKHARENLYYRADGEPEMEGETISKEGGGWKPGIHMPRWASRLTLEITGIRVERVKGISEEDAIAEGSPPGAIECDPNIYHPQRIETPIKYVWGFERIWDRINGKKPGAAWKDNPWVWVISFKRISQEAGQ